MVPFNSNSTLILQKPSRIHNLTHSRSTRIHNFQEKASRTLGALIVAQTLKNHHLINTIDFNVIPTGKFPYTTLV